MKLRTADFLTLLNAASGLIAIFLVMSDRVMYAPIFIIIGAVMDYFDGKVARRSKKQSSIGLHIDSLADVITFGVAPVVLGYAVIKTPIAVIGFTVYLLCGLLRLARHDAINDKKAFRGLTIPLAAIIICIIYYSGVPALFYPYIYIFLAVLMISWFKIKRII